MSAIDTVQNGGQGLLSQALQRLVTGQQTPPVGPPVSSRSLALSPITPEPLPAEYIHPHGHGHGHGYGHGTLFKKIGEAVTSALQSIQPDSDPNKVIEDAIARVFKDSGAAPDAGELAKKTAANGRVDGNSLPAAQDARGPDAARQAFNQSLQALGVNPEQFRNDFLAAIKDAQGGQVDPRTALKSFPAGSIVDTTL